MWKWWWYWWCYWWWLILWWLSKYQDDGKRRFGLHEQNNTESVECNQWMIKMLVDILKCKEMCYPWLDWVETTESWECRATLLHQPQQSCPSDRKCNICHIDNWEGLKLYGKRQSKRQMWQNYEKDTIVKVNKVCSYQCCLFHDRWLYKFNSFRYWQKGSDLRLNIAVIALAQTLRCYELILDVVMQNSGDWQIRKIITAIAAIKAIDFGRYLILVQEIVKLFIRQMPRIHSIEYGSRLEEP